MYVTSSLLNHFLDRETFCTIKICSITDILSNVNSHSFEECRTSAWNVREICSKVHPSDTLVSLRYASVNCIWYNEAVNLFVSALATLRCGAVFCSSHLMPQHRSTKFNAVSLSHKIFLTCSPYVYTVFKRIIFYARQLFTQIAFS